ncbi:MAG: hypothetical protein ACYSWO_12645 [Planctomycetota bacterium]|jgi:hypothetical protein
MEVDSKDFACWYDRLAACIGKLCDQGDIEIRNLDGRDITGMFVTEGVTVFLKDRPMEIWSDEPGELIVKHQRSGQGEWLMSLLKSNL